MGNEWTPQGYPSVVPTMRAEQVDRLLVFMQNVFDGEILQRAVDANEKITHAEVRIGHGMIEVSDANAAWPANETSLHVFVPNVDECFRRALEEGAVPLYEPADMPYGERSGGVRDPFGNSWFIATFRRGAGRGYYD
jgi:PhnB protein